VVTNTQCTPFVIDYLVDSFRPGLIFVNIFLKHFYGTLNYNEWFTVFFSDRSMLDREIFVSFFSRIFNDIILLLNF